MEVDPGACFCFACEVAHLYCSQKQLRLEEAQHLEGQAPAIQQVA
jgi:hypothetical protein